MLNTFKSSLVLAVVLSAVVGCSSNQAVEETETTMDPSRDTAGAGVGVSQGGVDAVDVEEPEVDPMADVPNVFYFEFNSAILTSEARSALLAHAENLKGNNELVRLEGHADERGSREYNMALGERRANAVRDFLVLQGVPASRIETVSYGEERPAVSGSGESVWSQNRRVELQ